MKLFLALWATILVFFCPTIRAQDPASTARLQWTGGAIKTSIKQHAERRNLSLRYTYSSRMEKLLGYGHVPDA